MCLNFMFENMFVLHCLLLATGSKNESVWSIFVAGEAYCKRRELSLKSRLCF